MGISITGGVKVPQGKFTVAKTPVPFVANAVNFDGTNDYLNRGALLTGAVDGEDFLLSAWLNLTGGNGNTREVFTSESFKMQFERKSAGKYSMTLKNSSGGTLWRLETTDSYRTDTNPGWHHILIAARFSGSPVGQFYIDDVVPALTVAVAPVNGDIDWTDTNIYIGSRTGGTDKWFGDMAELYMTNEYLDISIEANRRKFIDASGKPVDLGSDGSTPTGTASLVFLSGATVDWHTNKGSGGEFTEVGVLDTASSSPSD